MTEVKKKKILGEAEHSLSKHLKTLNVLNYTGLCTPEAHARLQPVTRMPHVTCFLCEEIAAEAQSQSLR